MFARLRNSEDTGMAVAEWLMQRDNGFHSKWVRELLEDFDKRDYMIDHVDVAFKLFSHLGRTEKDILPTIQYCC